MSKVVVCFVCNWCCWLQTIEWLSMDLSVQSHLDELTIP